MSGDRGKSPTGVLMVFLSRSALSTKSSGSPGRLERVCSESPPWRYGLAAVPGWALCERHRQDWHETAEEWRSAQADRVLDNRRLMLQA